MLQRRGADVLSLKGRGQPLADDAGFIIGVVGCSVRVLLLARVAALDLKRVEIA